MTKLIFKKKEEIVSKLKECFNSSLSTVVASVNRISSNAINGFRKEARELGVKVVVAPNSLLNKAVSSTRFLFLSDTFIGSNIVVFSTKNPRDAASICIKFSKNYENFKIKGVCFEDKLIALNDISILAALPSYKESLIRLVSILKVGSIGKLINILMILSNKEVKTII